VPKSIAQLITEGRGIQFMGIDAPAAWFQASWPDIEANLRAAGELLEAVEAWKANCVAKNSFDTHHRAILAAAQKLREATPKATGSP
jgi:hypothetical protein